MWNERLWITRKKDNTIEYNRHGVKDVMHNLILQIKCSFSKINSAFFCAALFYSIFISTLLKVALENFKRMLLVHYFDGFFRFKLIFKAFLLNWFKNLRAQFGLCRKRAGVWTPGPNTACYNGWLQQVLWNKHSVLDIWIASSAPVKKWH